MVDLRRIGGSELLTPPLILGGNVFGWTADREASFAVLDAFVAGGGRMIDTADVYSAWIQGHSGGESETLIGEWLARRGRRDDVLIATKVGKLAGEGGAGLAPARIAAAIDGSLRRLGTDHVDLYFAHADDETQDQEAVATAFDRVVRAGKVRALGASNFDMRRLGDVLDIQARGGLVRYQALQNEQNLLERGADEGALAAFCRQNGVGLTPYYGLASGYLAGKYRGDADFEGKPRGGAARRYHEGQGPTVLAAVDEVAAQTGATPAQVSLAWLAAQPGVVAPIASATSARQVEDLLGMFALQLNAAQIALLDRASGKAEPKVEGAF